MLSEEITESALYLGTFVNLLTGETDYLSSKIQSDECEVMFTTFLEMHQKMS